MTFGRELLHKDETTTKLGWEMQKELLVEAQHVPLTVAEVLADAHSVQLSYYNFLLVKLLGKIIYYIGNYRKIYIRNYNIGKLFNVIECY